MTQKQAFATLLAHSVVALAILIAATVLCYAGKLSADAVVALFGAAIGLLGANAQTLGGQVINGGPKPNYDKLAQTNPAELERVLAGQRGDTPRGSTTTTTTIAEPLPAEG
jgi:hypothetical protein